MSGPASDDSPVGEVVDRVDDRLDAFAEQTEHNLDTTMAWVDRKQGEFDDVSLGWAVAINVSMTALGIAVALLGQSNLLAAAGVAWAVLNGYPLIASAWRWLFS